MIPIYICDDNVLEKDYLERVIRNLLVIEDYSMEIVLSSTNPEDIIEHKLKNRERSIYFLDVDLKNDTYNGFTLAKRIRELDARGFLAFVTTHQEMMYETFRYRLEAMSYITKDNPDNLTSQVRDCLKEIDRLAGRREIDDGGYYTVKIGDSSYRIPIKDILCFNTTEGAVHRITLRTASQRLEFRGDLNSVINELGDGFIRVHRSYLVKSDKIKQVNYSENTLVLADDSVCLISRLGKKLLKEAGL